MLSSTVLISDAAGKVLQRYRYDPFGEIEQAKGNSDNRFLFNGKEADESGLSFYGARYYNSITGRWISRDPLSGKLLDPQTLNRYHFSLNNPLRYIDPDGRSVLDDLQTFFKYLDPRTIDKSYADLATGQISYQDFIMKAGLHEEAKAYAQYMPQVLEAYTIVIGGPELGIMSKSEMIFGKMVFQNAGKAAGKAGGFDIFKALVKAATGEGNFGIGYATRAEADELGKAWVGEGYRLLKNGSGWISANGTKVYRFAAPKSSSLATTGIQANFERLVDNVVVGNAHLDIIP